MKYWIDGVQQEVLIKLHLTTNDAVILRYIRDLFSSGKCKVLMQKSKAYYYIDTKVLLGELPILRIKLDTLHRRLTFYTKKHIFIRIELRIPVQDDKTPLHKYNRVFYYRYQRNAEEALFHHVVSTTT